MKIRKLRMFLIGLIFVATICSAQRFSYVPQAGFVPDKDTAIRIAEAVLLPVYGKKIIADERPFSAVLQGDTWRVLGHLDERTDGGVAEVEISKSDGRILHMAHSK
jgi:hypothetical protein